MIGPFEGWLGLLTFATALGCGLVAGIFFAFSTFVMPALARLPAPQGIAAMQSINVAVITPSVMVALFGTGVACIVLAAASLLAPSRPGAWLVLGAGVAYVAGTVLVTIAGNVPLNDSLAAVDAASAESARLWASYLTRWTAWNHIRTIAALAASALLTLALVSGRAS